MQGLLDPSDVTVLSCHTSILFLDEQRVNLHQLQVQNVIQDFFDESLKVSRDLDTEI